MSSAGLVWRAAGVVPALSASWLLAGCGVEAVPRPTLTSVAPARAHNDAPVTVALLGGPFRPALAIDTGSGNTVADPHRFSVSLFFFGDPETSAGRSPVTASAMWRGSGELEALFPAGLAPGSYDVEARDPRGQAARLGQAFTSLGPDLLPPVLIIEQPLPDAVLGEDAATPARVTVDDGDGELRQVTWSTTGATGAGEQGRCPLAVTSQRTACAFTFITPKASAPLEPFTIRVSAEDSAGHQVSQQIAAQIARIPELLSLSPREGPTAGGTVVRVEGANLIPDITRLFMDGVPIESKVESDRVITGVTSPHAQGLAVLTARSGTASSAAKAFEFIPPPLLRLISPTSGPASAVTAIALGGNHFRQDLTRIFLEQAGRRTEVSSYVVSPNRINADLPPGTGVVSIIAVDAIAGESALRDVFTYTSAAAGGP